MNELLAYLRAPRQSLRQEAFMMQRLAFLIRSGMPLTASITLIGSQANPATRNALQSVKERVERGKSLAESFSAFPHLVRDTSCEIIRIGELSGSLAENLSRLADDLKRKSSLRGKLIGALLYPAFVSLAALILAIGLVLFIFPKIIPLFAALGADLPLTTRVVLGVYAYLSHWGVLTGLFLIITGITWLCLIRRYTGMRRETERAILRMPLFGPFIRAYHLSNLARTLSLLLRSGMTLRTALPAAARATSHLLYRQEFARLADAVERGGGITAYLYEHPSLFPDLVAQMVQVGESSGTLAETLASVSAYYEEEVDERMKSLSSLVEPVLMIFMGLLVGWIAVRWLHLCMRLRSTSMHSRGLARTLNNALAAGRFAMRGCVCGFTFIEILVTLGILSSVMCLGLFATTDFLRKTSIADARDTLVTLLIHARVAAMSNAYDVSYGVCFDPREFASSILISGLPDCNSGDVFAFTPLSGTTTGTHIILSQASTILTIDVDRDGAITW